jgi:uncharacterized protein YggT (Ycf19 family)
MPAAMNPILQYWYFHLPNFILAAVMYTMLGRLVLSFFAPPNWQNYIWRAFTRITEPALKLVRIATPLGMPEALILVFGVLWLMLLRLGFFVGMGQLGLLPSVQGG